ALEPLVDDVHRLGGPSEKFGAPDSNKPPPATLQHGLSRHVVLKILQGVIPIAVAFERHSLPVAMDNEIKHIPTDSILWCDSVVPLQEALQNTLFEFARSSVDTSAKSSPFRNL